LIYVNFQYDSTSESSVVESSGFDSFAVSGFESSGFGSTGFGSTGFEIPFVAVDSITLHQSQKTLSL
jgi:hypothetical protein